ncbi:MAG: hypothetical protein KIH64_002705 [Mycobacterium sp.]|nr:hypothetical protein [Mycobacterium sp.]
MGRLLRHLLMVIVTAPIVAIAVIASPVNAAQSLQWEPQLVTAYGPIEALPAAPNAGLARAAVRTAPKALPPGVGIERGLQIQTLLAERAISAAFPEIKEIGGVRADSMKWHPNGLAIDVIIPNWDTPAGRALGDRITEFAFAHAEEFGLEYVIWQQTYRPAKGKPHLMDDLGSPDANHYTHVHISSYGGGFPKGDETYVLRDNS